MENQGKNTNYHADRSGKTIEEIYQKKTQLEHILLRPDTYVGSCEHQLEEKWVFDVATEERPAEMNYRRIDYVPALYKIFDEILVNAADHLIRDPAMNTIEVNIKPEENMISVYNNGAGLPVCIHKEHNVYIPEMLFGHLLTSDNYNDNEKKVVGGRNGFGAKLTNVFSTKFHLETLDSNVKKHYSQIFESNMTVINPPEIKTSKQQSFTRITFWPDLAKFGMEELDPDMVAMMTKRVFDIAGTTGDGCKVYLNGKKLSVNNFYDYIKVYLKADEPVHEVCSDRWEIAFAISPEEQFRQVSFVNSICTTKGGTHVTHVTDQLVETLMKKVKAKNKGGMDIKPAHIRNHLWVFVKSLIENPAFDSQTKDTLTTKQARFGSKCEISDQFVNKVVKSGVIEQIIMWAKAKEQVSLKKMKNTANVQRVVGVPKLEDANEAGTKNGHLCTLILTEGDSAKSLAVAGLSVIGRDLYGVFPLRGKVLNVRDANHKTITANVELQNILKIVGLIPNKEYLSLSQLRYGSIMIMTDQDYDGSHIKGLLINFFDYWWPKLLQDHPGFLKEFITPIVKATKKNSTKNSVSFYTMPEYENWKTENKNAEKEWMIKYYKGLGTSTTKEAKEYFAALDQHRVEFVWDDGTKENIDLAFNKKRADDRKNWINAYEDGVFVDTSNYKLNYSDFINKELVLFSKYNVLRAIPSVVDGFKPTQRKILFASFKKKLAADIKVAQFVGYISEKAAYHHGEVSLETAIINMAQNFVGSNNINLLFPSGQFGTRLAGGSDAASARYIFTRLCTYTRNIFMESDDHILKYQNEEGQWIEPEWYCPIIPMVLVNGADGIGTGWSTAIPNYNPMEIIANLRRALRNEPMTIMRPWYKGFLGTITPMEKEVGKYDARGHFEKKGETCLEITELPIKKWTSDYKENVLQALLPNAPIKKDDKGNAIVQKDPLLEDYREYHTESTVHFILKMSPEQMARAEAEGVEKAFKLKTTVNETNMILFDVYGKIRKYDSANDIMEDFFDIRLKMYHKRKEYLVDKLKRERFVLDEKTRFILLVVNEQLELRKRKKAELIKDLQDLNFKPWSEIQKGNLSTLKRNSADKSTGDGEDQGEDENKEAKKEASDDYDYLVGMPMWNLTLEKVEEMKKLVHKKVEELDILVGTSVETMWDRDLVDLQEALLKAWAKEEADEKKAFEDAMKKLKGSGGGGSGGEAAGTKKGKGRGKGAAKPILRGGDSFGAPPPARVRQKATFEEFSNPVGTVTLVDRPKPEYVLPVKSSTSRAAPTNVEIKELDLDNPDDSRGPMALSPDAGIAASEGAPAKRPRRAVKTRAAKKDEQEAAHLEEPVKVAPVKPPEPPADESKMSLLQRLLSRQKSRNENLSDISIRKPSTTSHTVLDSGTNDLFGFTSTSIDLTKPYTFDLDDDCLMLPSTSTSTVPAASSSSEPSQHPIPSGSTIDIPDTQPLPKLRNPAGRPARGRKRAISVIDDDNSD